MQAAASAVTFAVLGCGRIGRVHANGLARHPRARLLSVFDISDAAADETAARLGVAKAANIDEILNDKAIQAVLIATPTNTHVDVIIAAAKAGKAILCEKPIDLDMQRVLMCEREIAPYNATIMIGFNRRFDPAFRAIRDRVQRGEIGKVEQVIISSRDPEPPAMGFIGASGGMFRDMTIHDFDMARYLVGDIAEVHAFGSVLVDQAIGDAGDIDSAMISLRARSGALVHINNTRRCVYGYDQRLEVFGAEGMLLAGNRTATTVLSSTGKQSGAGDLLLHTFIERYSEAYAAEVDHFVECLQGGITPLTNFRDGIEALRVAEAALESMRTGRTVKLD
jgi:myo-inositol 2-dehydrogenase / D-chiro-inositol 1-dehydrogenase